MAERTSCCPCSADKAHAAADIHDKGEALWMLLAFAKHLPLRIPTSHVDRLAPSNAILSSSLEAFFFP